MGAPPGAIGNAIQKERLIPILNSLKKVIWVLISKRPMFVILFDPTLPSISKIERRQWKAMRQDLCLVQVINLLSCRTYKSKDP